MFGKIRRLEARIDRLELKVLMLKKQEEIDVLCLCKAIMNDLSAIEQSKEEPNPTEASKE